MKLSEENIRRLEEIHKSELLAILYMIVEEDIKITETMKSKIKQSRINLGYILNQYLKEKEAKNN